jgi:hypothetical protein
MPILIRRFILLAAHRHVNKKPNLLRRAGNAPLADPQPGQEFVPRSSLQSP